MEANIQTPKPNGKSNGHLLINKESRSTKTSSLTNGHISIFDPNKYMLKLPKTKKVTLPRDPEEQRIQPKAARTIGDQMGVDNCSQRELGCRWDIDKKLEKRISGNCLRRQILN